jgi:hypothetical protein
VLATALEQKGWGAVAGGADAHASAPPHKMEMNGRVEIIQTFPKLVCNTLRLNSKCELSHKMQMLSCTPTELLDPSTLMG